MRDLFYKYFKIVYKFSIHILLLGFTTLVLLVVISDLLVPQVQSLVFASGFLIVCILVACLCLFGIWQATSSQLRIDRFLFGFNMTEARNESANDVVYFYSIMNVYFIFNTTIVVGLWFIFPEQLARAESLAYILTILSALSGYSTRVIRQRLDDLDS